MKTYTVSLGETFNRPYLNGTVVSRYNGDVHTDTLVEWHGETTFDPEAFIASMEAKYGITAWRGKTTAVLSIPKGG